MTDLSSRVDEISQILSSYVRPLLQAHGGDIALLRVSEEKVFVRITGACQACPSLSSTMQETVLETLQTHLNDPSISVIIDNSVSDNLIAEALKIIRRKE